MELALIALAIVVVVFALRYRRVAGDVASLRAHNDAQDALIQSLIRRVYELETAGQPASEQPALLPEQVAQPEFIPSAAPDLIPAEQPAPVAAPRDDWEAIIGGSWLNKAGVLILVVGIALFLGYSLTQLGPMGKAAIGLGVGVSMLIGGLAVERLPRYITFGRGIVAGGWAAVYFTAYAMHGLKAARVIESPALGAALLLAVSAAIIFHSFVYSSQTVTALAFLIGFVSLNLSPLTSFSVIAVVLLALSSIAVAARFDWPAVALTGVILTYFTFGARYEVSVYGQPGLLNGLIVLWTYWVAFEIFDLLDLKRRGLDRGMARALAVVNGLGFITMLVAFHLWEMRIMERTAYYFSAGGAFVASAAARWMIAGASQVTAQPVSLLTFVRRLFSGGFEGSAAFALGLLMCACGEWLTGLRVTLALIVLCQAVVIAGFVLGDGFLFLLGGLGFIVPFIRLMFGDLGTASNIEILGHSIRGWTPVALLMAILFLANRYFTRSGLLYSFGASLLLGVVIDTEIAKAWIPVAWYVLGLAALYAGLRFARLELRLQGYLIAAAAFAGAATHSMDDYDGLTRRLTITLVVIGFYTAQRLMRAMDTLRPAESPIPAIYAITGTILLTLLIANESQGRLMTIAFGVEGISVLVLGFAMRERVLRLSGLALFVLCISKLFLYDLNELDTLSRILSFIVLGLMLLAASWIYTRFREQIRRLL